MAKKTVASTKVTSKKTKSVKAKSARKTAAVKKTVSRRQTPVTTPEVNEMMLPTLPTLDPQARLWLIGGAVVLALGVAAYFLKGFAIAALVNGRPVSRIAVIKQLEKTGGSQVLDGLVTQALIDDAASKQKIVINPGEIDAEMAKLDEQVKSQGRNLDELLSMQGMTRDVLKKQIELQKTVEKLAGADAITVTDEEIKKFTTDNSALFPKTLGADEIASRAAVQLKSQKSQDLIQAFIDQLHQSAKIQYFVNYQ